jgi:hypothetical protein
MGELVTVVGTLIKATIIYRYDNNAEENAVDYVPFNQREIKHNLSRFLLHQVKGYEEVGDSEVDEYCYDKFKVYPTTIRFHDGTIAIFAIDIKEFDKIYESYLMKVSTINMQQIWN